MKEIDFLPRSFHQAMLRRYRTRRNAMLSVALLVALGFSHLVIATRIRSAQASLIALTGGDRKTQRDQVSDLEKRKSTLERQAAMISRVDDDAPLDAVIGQINQLMSDTMALRAINVEPAAPASADKPGANKKDVDPLLERGRTEVVLRAVATSDVEIGIFFGRLTACPLFEDIRLTFSRETAQGGRPMREFELKFAIKRVSMEPAS